MSDETPMRAYKHEGLFYLIRDIRDEHGQFKRCEFAVCNDRGEVEWRPCREGVDFAEMASMFTEPVA